jgi:putative membrane protein
MMGDGWGWGMMMGGFGMVAFWGVIIWAGYALVTRRGSHETAPPSQATEPSAQEILARRYARGELSAEEYEAMRRHLNDTAAVDVPPAAAGRDAVRAGP